VTLRLEFIPEALDERQTLTGLLRIRALCHFTDSMRLTGSNRDAAGGSSGRLRARRASRFPRERCGHQYGSLALCEES
jgi:hypothetical protein